MLKDILDETSRGCYDFMYLRIGKSLPLPYTSHKLTRLPDFANNCKYVVLFPPRLETFLTFTALAMPSSTSSM
jgi:hypothetical protein